jgi:hypothetical protein
MVASALASRSPKREVRSSGLPAFGLPRLGISNLTGRVVVGCISRVRFNDDLLGERDVCLLPLSSHYENGIPRDELASWRFQSRLISM